MSSARPLAAFAPLSPSLDIALYMLIFVVEGKKTMRARFKGFCRACNRPTWPGQEIRKTAFGAWVHAVCPADHEPARQIEGGYREMAARFPSTCPTCNGPIAEGDRIHWRKGEKAVHAACQHAYARAAEDAPERPGEDRPLVRIARHLDYDRALAAENYGDPDDVERPNF